MHCYNCGTKITDTDKFCLNCGANLDVRDSTKPRKLFESREETFIKDEPQQKHQPNAKEKDLEQKWWFRFIKVIYILCYVVAILIISVAGYYSKTSESLDTEKSEVRCNNGKSYNPGKNSIFLYSDYISSYDDDKIRILCAYDTTNFYAHNAPIYKNYTFDAVKKPADWSPVFRVWFWGYVSVIILFEIVRRIFYYIVTGRKFLDYRKN